MHVTCETVDPTNEELYLWEQISKCEIFPIIPSFLMTCIFVSYDRICLVLQKLNRHIQYEHHFKALGMYWKTMGAFSTKWTLRWIFRAPRHHSLACQAHGWSIARCWRPRIATSSSSCVPRHRLSRLKFFISPSNFHIAYRWVPKSRRFNEYTTPSIESLKCIFQLMLGKYVGTGKILN